LTSIGKIIPKNTAVIIKGTDNSISLTRDDNITDYTGDNELQGVNYETPQADGYTYYVLSKVGDNFGFYKLASTKSLGAHKAYLPVAKGDSAPAFYGFDFEEEMPTATAIDHSTLTIDHYDDAWYTMDGRKLNGVPTTKGVFINNGRKVVIK
jgi:hypothetical protein